MADCIPNYKDAVWSFYRYEPSVAGAVIFCILFGITSGLHAFQMYTTRTWYLTALVIGGLCKSRTSDIHCIRFSFRTTLMDPRAKANASDTSLVRSMQRRNPAAGVSDPTSRRTS